MIRHAVGIDERRAKFRQDLVEKAPREVERRRSWKTEKFFDNAIHGLRGDHDGSNGGEKHHANGHPVYQSSAAQHQRFSGSHERLSLHTPVPGAEGNAESTVSLGINVELDSEEEDEKAEQDIEEVWFPGAHGDIGGGWDLPKGEEPLSHGPLVWMVSGSFTRVFFNFRNEYS